MRVQSIRKARAMGRMTDGTTLVEVMIAAAILAVLLVAFLSIMYSASNLTASQREASLAAYDLQSAVEDTLAIPFDSLATRFPDGSTLTAYNDASLLDERIGVQYLESTSDAVTYRLTIQFTNAKGFSQRDSIVMRRAR
ncbi:MAG: type II secretion system protein [Planctomycetes bacterium]|nr:type II secretion system protein [Planctomycetota bacterium]